MKLIRDLLTGQDDETYDLVRVLTFLSSITGLALQVYVVAFKGQAFDFIAFGTGLGLLLAAGAGGMWARKDIDPPVK